MHPWPAQQQPASVSWQFGPQWRVLPGMAYGARQSVMLGFWDFASGAWHGATLDAALSAQVHEAVPPDLAAGRDTQALLLRLLFWTGAVQRQHKVPVFGSARVWRDPDPALAQRWHIALPYANAQACWAALGWVSQAAQQVVRGAAGASAPGFDALSAALAPFEAPGFNTIRFLQAADVLDLPWRGVVPGVIAYGQGHACRWFESSYTDRTPVLGTRLARDKFRTAQVLRQLGMPAPTHARASSAQHAVQLARQLGYPVVVKPADRDQGQGVSADLRDDGAVLAAHARAIRFSDNILVEKHAYGNDYRMTVLNGQLIKTIVRRAAGVVGDGRHTLAELVAREHDDPAHRRASQLRGHPLLELDAEALELLAQNGLTPQTVPPAQHFVALRRRANVSAGGTPQLEQGPIHPDNQRLAERAAQALQLDLAGVDLIMPDIAQSWLRTGALICEVNGQPQLGSSTTPGIYRQVLRQLLPAECRIPVVLVLGDGNALAHRLMELLADRSPPWGLACSDGVWEGPVQLTPAQGDGFGAARILMASRVIAGAVIVMTPEQIVGSGLPCDRVDVIVVARSMEPGIADLPATGTAWPMLMDHLHRAIVCPQQAAATLPHALLAQHPLALRMVPDDDAALASETLHCLLLPAREGSAEGASADPAHAAPGPNP